MKISRKYRNWSLYYSFNQSSSLSLSSAHSNHHHRVHLIALLGPSFQSAAVELLKKTKFLSLVLQQNYLQVCYWTYTTWLNTLKQDVKSSNVKNMSALRACVVVAFCFLFFYNLTGWEIKIKLGCFLPTGSLEEGSFLTLKKIIWFI